MSHLRTSLYQDRFDSYDSASVVAKKLKQRVRLPIILRTCPIALSTITAHEAGVHALKARLPCPAEDSPARRKIMSKKHAFA
jgi:hypothetical protein